MTITAFPLQAAGVTFGQEPTYTLLDHLFTAGVASGLSVSQRSAGADMSVDVSAGAAYVPVSSGGKRQFLSSATSNSGAGTASAEWTATFAGAHGTLPRIDRVVAMVQDNIFDSGGQYRGMFRVVQGTASSGATLTNLTGAPALPANCVHIRYVLVPAAATAITTANISTEARAQASIGGSTPAVPQALPHVNAKPSVDQIITNNTPTLVVLAAENEDTSAMHDLVTNNSRLVAKQAGLFIVKATLQFDANATGSRGVTIRKNAAGVSTGGTQLERTHLKANDTTTHPQQAVAVVRLALNDYVEVFALHTAGGGLGVLAAETTVSLTYIGA